MRKRTITATMTGFFLAMTLALTGGANAAVVLGTGNVGTTDIFDFQCTSPLTHCMVTTVCDEIPWSADTYEVTIGVYSPLTMVGQGNSATASPGPGQCSWVASVCRTPASAHGAMKALVNVNHPLGVSVGLYQLSASCYDASSNMLPDSTTKLINKTNEY